ncbi:MAG TPA: hypothetical protein GX702_15925 [Chloroflexi bacterium]|jgi:hypothetical protein|nr:hypothetical protein [Chloroflexota bacterium]
MERRRRVLDWERARGESVTHGDVRITPEARVLTLRLPWGGVVWNRPTAVMVEQSGSIRRVPIVDVTLLLQVGLLVVGMMLPLMVGRLERWARRRR